MSGSRPTSARLVSGLPHEVRTESDDAALKAAIDGEYAGLVGEMSGLSDGADHGARAVDDALTPA